MPVDSSQFSTGYPYPPGESSQGQGGKAALVFDDSGAIRGDVKQVIAALAYQSYMDGKKEACGFIIRKGKKLAVFPVRNISSEPTKDFHGHPDDVKAAEDAGEPVMMWHTHPDLPPVHDLADRTNAERNQLPSLIMNWPLGHIEIYWPGGWRAPLIGRPFVHGVLDCFTLVRDRLADDGIMLPDFDREDDWWLDKKDSRGNLISKAKNYYLDVFVPQGPFVTIDPKDIQPLDCILIQLPKSDAVNHCAVYEGDNIIIHHPPKRLSARQPYSTVRGWNGLATHSIVRHKSRV